MQHYHLCSIINNAVMDNGHSELLIFVDQYNYPVSIITRIGARRRRARRRRISMDKLHLVRELNRANLSDTIN